MMAVIISVRPKAAFFLTVIFGLQRLSRGVQPMPSVFCMDGTFMKIDNEGWKTCVPCKRCPRGWQVVSECSKFSDTVCEPCTSGTYNDGSSRRCEPCKRCHRGQFVRRKCTKKRNAECKSCPTRMYSRRSNSIYCSECRTCKLHEEKLLPCSKRSNTVCGNCSVSYYRNKVTGECQPCSVCPPDKPWLIVEECFRKLGHTSTLCQAGLYYPEITTINEVHTGFYTTNDVSLFRKDSFLITVVVLGLVLGSTFVFVTSFVLLHTYRCQWFIRRCRDLSVVDTDCCKSTEHDIPIPISSNVEQEFVCIEVGNENNARKNTIIRNRPEKLNLSSDNDSFVIDDSEIILQIINDELKTKEKGVSNHSLPIVSDLEKSSDENNVTPEDVNTWCPTNGKRNKRRRKNDDGTRNAIFSNPKYFPVGYYCTV